MDSMSTKTEEGTRRTTHLVYCKVYRDGFAVQKDKIMHPNWYIKRCHGLHAPRATCWTEPPSLLSRWFMSAHVIGLTTVTCSHSNVWSILLVSKWLSSGWHDLFGAYMASIGLDYKGSMKTWMLRKGSRYLAGYVAGEPIKSLVQTLTGCWTSALYIPAYNKSRKKQSGGWTALNTFLLIIGYIIHKRCIGALHTMTKRCNSIKLDKQESK